MNITVIQPPYFAGEKPDETIARFLLDQLKQAQADLIVLPEYSNAGGLSDPEKELAALPRAKEMLNEASAFAASAGKMVAINVLEDREGKLWNSTYLFDREGQMTFRYDKIHLPPSEVALKVSVRTKMPRPPPVAKSLMFVWSLREA